MMKKIKFLSILPTLFMLFLIFGFSAQDGERSGSLSYTVSYEIVCVADAVLPLEIPEPEIPAAAESIHFYVRKLAHITEYFLLALSIYLPAFLLIPEHFWKPSLPAVKANRTAAADTNTSSVSASTIKPNTAASTSATITQNAIFRARLLHRRLLFTFFSAVVCSALDEFHQTFVSQRCGTPVDVLIDNIGTTAACLLLWLCTCLYYRYRTKHSFTLDTPV